MYLPLVFLLFSLKLPAQWTLELELNSGDCVKDIEFISKSKGIFVTSNIIGVTENKGETWELDTLDGVTDLRTIDFIDSDTGILCCSPGVSEDLLLTYNGGGDWIYPVMNQGISISHIELVEDGNIIFSECLGFSTSVVITEEFYSNNLEIVNIPGSANCYDLEFLNNDVGFAIGDFVTGEPFISTVYKTIDGGHTWYTNASMNGPLFYIDFVSEETGYGVGYESRVWKTIDGGESWFILPFDFGGYAEFDAELSLGKIYFYSDSIGLLQASKTIDGEIYPGIYRTNNGGESWYKTNIDISNNQLYDFFCLSTDTCFAATCGAIFRTTNGGGVETGIDNLAGNTVSISMYPNPTYSVINLNYLTGEKILSINTFSAIGETVNLQFDKFNKADTHLIPSGIYYTEIITEKGRAACRWMKM